MNNFTLKDLKQGMVLHTRDNQKYTMINDKEFYVEDISNLGSTYAYNKDLTSEENNLEDILKITFGNETVYERPKEVEKTPIGWKPEVGETYYYISCSRSVFLETNLWKYGFNNINHYSLDRLFKTKKEAEKHLEWLKAKRTLEIEIARLNEGWTPDWSNINECKYYVRFNHRGDFLMNTDTIFQARPNSMYLKNYNHAEKLIKTHRKELEIYFEVEQ